MTRLDDHAYKGYSIRVNRMSDIVWIEKGGHTISTYSGVSEKSVQDAHKAIDALTANPHPKGWTAEDERLRDECVASVQGTPGIRNAYAVCTAMVQKHKRDGNPADVIAAVKSLAARLAKVL